MKCNVCGSTEKICEIVYDAYRCENNPLNKYSENKQQENDKLDN